MVGEKTENVRGIHHWVDLVLLAFYPPFLTVSEHFMQASSSKALPLIALFNLKRALGIRIRKKTRSFFKVKFVFSKQDAHSQRSFIER